MSKHTTIRELFIDVCLRNTGREALTFDEKTITYDELYRNVENIAYNFRNQHVDHGKKIAVILPNCIEYIYIFFAAFYAGIIVIPMNDKWERNEIIRVLLDAKPDAIIYKKIIGVINFERIINEYIKDYQKIENVYVCEQDFGENEKSFAELLSTPMQKKNMDSISSHDWAMISYTSGTTGAPKGVVIDNYCLVKTSIESSRIIFDKGDSPLSVAPLYAAQGFLSLLMQFLCEGKMTYLSTFNPNDILLKISKGENNVLHTQPTMWTILLSCNSINFTDFSKIKRVVVSGSICTPELAKKIEKVLKCSLVNMYGLIEATSAVTSTRKDDSSDIRFHTVGRPINGVEFKIVDENRELVPEGEVGELAVRGYNMVGYYNNDKLTNEIIDYEGWLYTGDLAKSYDGKNIAIVGRCKDMIIRGGFNVYPSDIEEVIMEHSGVMDVAVVGRRHEIIGEQIVAFIVKKPCAELTKFDIIKFCQGKIAKYKIPDDVYFIDEMPIILAGKVAKNELIKMAEEFIVEKE